LSEKDTIIKFYTSFQQGDWKGMQVCYHPDIHFSDPVFPDLHGGRAMAMWHMLLSASSGVGVSFSNVTVKGQSGSCQWEAKYLFSKTGKKVHNIIRAEFLFQDGLIIRHQDTFDLWRWSRMALGVSGVLLGWSPLLKGKIRSMASENLFRFIAKNPQYGN
jgi:ketosteroid isomerase-like protein